MSKREINLSNKILYNTTTEDIIFNSPFKIPPKGLQELISLKGITPSEVAYYDIAPTCVDPYSCPSTNYRSRVPTIHSANNEEASTIMGQISNI